MTHVIVLASNNAGKLREFEALLAPYGLEILPLSEFCREQAEETGLSFIENAIIKARHAARHSTLPAIADDSGLEVDALNGEPGIHSARYAGPGADDSANNAKLLARLHGVAPARRTARFHCVLAYLRHADDPCPIIAHGIWQGRILEAPRGEGGFGYDPLFAVPGRDCSAAELDRDEKNRLSHRGQALRQLAATIQRLTDSQR